MQGKAGEVMLAVTSHNQKQQHKQRKRQTQTAANRPQEVVCTAPKTTTNRKPQQTNRQQNVKSFKASTTIMHADTGDM
jgi:hypothetical protein